MNAVQRLMQTLGAILVLYVCVTVLAFMLPFRTFFLWLSANTLAAADGILAVWTPGTPAISWGIMGFLLGATAYFALIEAPRFQRPALRRVFFSLPFAIIAAALLAGGRLMPAGSSSASFTSSGTGAAETFAGIECVWIPPGRFRMGSPSNEPGREDDETAHRVTLTKGFWLGRIEITQAQWRAVMGTNPSYFKGTGDDCPVDNVSWDDCRAFLAKLNQQPPGGFRLPTEAEWEYACRAGAGTAYGFGNDPVGLDAHAWFARNGGEKTHPGGEKSPNAWGLLDMHGNVWEWVADWYAPYAESGITDPAPPASGQYHILRGGAWTSSPAEGRAARRYIYLEGYFRPKNDIGFRIARDEEPAPAEPSSSTLGK